MRDKFPQAHNTVISPKPLIQEGKPFDADAFPAGRISEVVPSGFNSGLSLMIAALLGDPDEACPHPEIILLDGGDSFDPDSFSGTACSKVLWVRCSTSLEMLRATDMLLNDGNIPFVVIDSTGLDRRELSLIRDSSWLRIKRMIEKRAGSWS